MLFDLRSEAHTVYFRNIENSSSNENIMAKILNELPQIVNIVYDYVFQ